MHMIDRERVRKAEAFSNPGNELAAKMITEKEMLS